MVRCHLGVLVAVLAALSLASAWWQHHLYVTQLRATEQQRDTLKAELEDQRRKGSVNQWGLEDCRTELEAAKDALRSSAGHDPEAARRAAAEHGRLRAEHDRLRAEHDRLRAERGCAQPAEPAGAPGGPCAQRLAEAARELGGLRQAVRQRALSARASRARLLAAGRSLASRARAVRGGVSRRLLEKDTTVELFLEFYTQQIVSLVTNAGLRVEAKSVRRIAASKVGWNSSETGFDSALLRAPQDRRRRARNPAHRRRAAPGEGVPADPADPASLPVRRDAGGSPRHCIAAVVPFRGRRSHMETFGRHIAAFLASPEASALCWSFFIVEQYDADLFNRGWLFNVGLALAESGGERFKCVVIQDLDTLPEIGAGVDFSNCSIPTQLSSEIQCYGWLPPYASNAGGVVAIKPEHWYQVNGFANDYRGWGGEDDDLRLRLHATALLRGSCGSFCDLGDRGFEKKANLTEFIGRPVRGRGRFICLDEGSHTPRRHGDMEGMKSMLKQMRKGSTRWAVDGLSDLSFELVGHRVRGFPGAPVPEAARLHWVRAVPELAGRFDPRRVRLVLGGGACAPHCRAQRRCAAAPRSLPDTVARLDHEVEAAFRGCLATGRAGETLGYWLVTRGLLVTPLNRTSGDAGGLLPSWQLSEGLRVALSAPDDGEPAIVVRAVPRSRLEEVAAGFRADPRRVQMPLADACVGTYKVSTSLGKKHTVNVGSDDCEQRSWKHFFSFQVLRRPRGPLDRPVCVGEANGTWTLRVSLSEDCSGTALGIAWNHKSVFYIGEDAAGPPMCVMYRTYQKKDNMNWSRWMVAPKDEYESCEESWEGYHTHFVFRSMRDSYEPPRVFLCVESDELGRLKVRLERARALCEDASAGGSFAVLQAAFASSERDVFCVGRSLVGDRIDWGRSCKGEFVTHVAAFAAPSDATGRAWCVGKKEGISGLEYRVAPGEACNTSGFEHALGFREVALEEMSEESGLLALDSL